MAVHQNVLETIGSTPVIKLNRIGPENVDIYVKAEAFNPMGSVKDRLALGVIEAAEAAGTLAPGQTVVEATSGNTGIGLAMVCAYALAARFSIWHLLRQQHKVPVEGRAANAESSPVSIQSDAGAHANVRPQLQRADCL